MFVLIHAKLEGDRVRQTVGNELECDCQRWARENESRYPSGPAVGVGMNEKDCPLTGSNDRPCHYADGDDHQITSDTHYHCAKRA